MNRVSPISLFLLCCLLVGCQGAPPAGESAITLQESSALSALEGDVVVLLMGKEKCPGTEAAMPFLNGYSGTCPEGVTVARLDVPPEGKTLKSVANLPPALHYGIDADRQTADAFDFFYYPTLFIFDRDGFLRFRGGCEPAHVKSTVAALLAEEPGAAKVSFNQAVPGKGDRALDFAGKTIDGESVTFDRLRGSAPATLLIFSSTNCPFSKTAMGCVVKLRKDYEKRGVSIVIVNSGSGLDKAAPFYSKATPGIPVLVDEKNEISGEKYGVQTVPFFCAIDADGVIAHRMPFDETTAREAIDSALGVASGPVKVRAKGAG